MIKKLKKCIICENLRPIYSKKMCLNCYKQLNIDKFKINKISNIHKERNKQYVLLKEQYLKEHTVCEFPNCTSKKVDLHHKKGRVGSNLFNYFCALCRLHHIWVHEHPKEARNLNLLI